MFESQEKPTGTQYTATAALILMALIFSPAVLLMTQPFGYASASLAVACSALCLAFARRTWKNSSHLTIPSIATGQGGAK
jgi:hypothetical protein